MDLFVNAKVYWEGGNQTDWDLDREKMIFLERKIQGSIIFQEWGNLNDFGLNYIVSGFIWDFLLLKAKINDLNGVSRSSRSQIFIVTDFTIIHGLHVGPIKTTSVLNLHFADQRHDRNQKDVREIVGDLVLVGITRFKYWGFVCTWSCFWNSLVVVNFCEFLFKFIELLLLTNC
jgi:hypothetical protein